MVGVVGGGPIQGEFLRAFGHVRKRLSNTLFRALETAYTIDGINRPLVIILVPRPIPHQHPCEFVSFACPLSDYCSSHCLPHICRWLDTWNVFQSDVYNADQADGRACDVFPPEIAHTYAADEQVDCTQLV